MCHTACTVFDIINAPSFLASVEEKGKRLRAGEGLAGRTRVVVADAEVIALMQGQAADGDSSGDAIVLRLMTAQALEVARALDFAREVRVVARPADEP